jgi:imidazolonepropionase-like amidohydrolase
MDGRGKFLMPGLIDTHIHLQGGRVANPDGSRGVGVDIPTGRRFLHGYLYSGVTAVYDAANYDKFIFAMRDAERTGRMISPRIFAAGHLITRPNGYGAGGGGGTVDSYEEGVRNLDALFADKPDIVKFILAPHNVGGAQEMPTFDPTLLHRLIIYSNEHGFRTTVHAVEGPVQRIAVEAGIDALAHPVYMTATDDRLAPLIAAKGLPVSTTLIVLKNMFDLVDDPSFFDEPLYRAILTDEDRAFFRDAERRRYMATSLGAWGRQAYAFATANLRKLYAAGGILALGTDRTIGAAVHQELEAIVTGLGVTPLEAIRMGTLNAAIYLHAADRLGAVEEGKLADLVLLRADPTKDIRNSRAIDTVILGGRIVDRAALDLPINRR